MKTKTITVTRKETIEFPREITVPSYWKTKYQRYMVYEKDGETIFAQISLWDNIHEIAFNNGEPVHKLPFEKVEPSTAGEFAEAFDRLIAVEDDLVNIFDNSINHDTEAIILHKQVIPTVEPIDP